MSRPKKNQESETATNKPPLSPICTAVKIVRQEFKESQQAFAERVGVSLVSVNRWEQGHQEPSEPRILFNLCGIAAEKRLDKERDVFAEAARRQLAQQNPSREFVFPYEIFVAPRGFENRLRPIREWRLLMAARLAILSFPELIPITERALAPVLELIDERLSQEGEINELNYAALEKELTAAAERAALQKLKHRRKNP